MRKPGGAAKRNTAQREQDLVYISERYVKGDSQAAIARDLSSQRPYSLSRQSITHDIKLIQSRWRIASCRHVDERKAEELARIDFLEREYWRAWERSCKDAQEKTGKRRTQAGQVTEEKAAKEWGRDGDPRFLEGVRWCIGQRCKILGLEVVRAEVSGPEGGPVMIASELDSERTATIILEEIAMEIERKNKLNGNGHEPKLLEQGTDEQKTDGG